MTVGVCQPIAVTHTICVFMICSCCLFVILIDTDVGQFVCAFCFNGEHLVTRKIQTAEICTTSDVFNED